MELLEVMDVPVTLIHRCMHMSKLIKFCISDMCRVLYIN